MRVIIMVGLPGSGKSTWLDRLSGKKTVCSADSFFTYSGGRYIFDATKLPDAHNACMMSFISTLSTNYGQTDIVAVDNTNTTIAEIAPYISVSRAFWIEPEIVFMDCPPHVATGRNVHGVPRGAILRIANNISNLRRDWPVYWPVPKIVESA